MTTRPAIPDLRRIATILGLVILASVAQAEEYPVGTADSMWHDPYMIGSYRHWDEIYPVRDIPRSGPVSALDRAPPIQNLTYMRGTTERSIDKYFELSRATGLVVIRDDAIVFERYALGADDASKFTSMSVAKSIVSTLVGFAIDDGLIESVGDPIDRYVPELAGTGYDGVPIKAVLQMSSGMAFIEDYTASGSDSTRLWLETAHYRSTPLNTFVTQMERKQDPFADFNYKGIDTAALGWLIAAVTGRSLSAYAAEKLWGPLGMEADASWGIDGRGDAASELAFCCVQATLRDFARFGLFMLHRGEWNGTTLLSAGWVDAATAIDGDQVAFGRLYAGYPLGYGYQWWLLPGDDGAYMAVGINGQFVYVNPARNMVVAATHVWRSFWDAGLEKEFYALIDGFIAATE
jgi:CubicO group peptidase (beta-lactamase class C family)